MIFHNRLLSRSSLFLIAFLFLPLLSAFGAVPADAAGAGQKIFQWRPFLAPFHAVVLHFPIGFVAGAVILELYSLRRPNADLRHATVLILWLSFVSGVVSAGFGILRAQTGAYESEAVELHRAFGLSVPAFIVATLIAHKIAYRQTTARAWIYTYRSLLTGTLAMIVVAGHFGGNLTHGSRYLVENAPEFVRELMQETPRVESAAVALNENQRYYTEKVQPILAAKCYQCHGSEKQKGKYRMDKPELALKGGESGKAAIAPCDPAESYLVRLILLPRDHDDAMPPSGKKALTMDEIMTILTWIQQGAAFPTSATAVPVLGQPSLASAKSSGFI